MNSPKPRQGIFNRFQTFAYGLYVPTSMDAHFDPYGEAAVVGKLRPQMENVPRLTITVQASGTQPAKPVDVSALRSRAMLN